ncbi:MAG: FliM/FliN family flagellar motor switch protein [Pseudomonadota bacterium]
MMGLAPNGIGDALPTLDADQTQWAHHAARLLTLEGFTTKVVPLKDGNGNWYLSDSLAFRLPHQSRAPLGAAGDALVDALARNDEILSAIERATGIAAEFKDYGHPGSDLAIVRIFQGGEHLGDIAPLIAPPIPLCSSPMMPIPIALAAARLSLEEAEKLGAGDLVLLSHGQWDLIEQHPSETHQTLALEPSTGRLAPAFDPTSKNLETAPMTDPADKGQMTVPVAVHLPDTMLTQQDLAQLAEAGSIDLGPVTEGLHVTLSVGGRPVGGGEIVRIGHRFAALLESPSPPASDADSRASEPEPPSEPHEQPEPTEFQPADQFEAEPK